MIIEEGVASPIAFNRFCNLTDDGRKHLREHGIPTAPAKESTS